MYRTMFVFWQAVKDEFPDAWGKPPTRSRLMHSAGIQAMGVLMDRIMTRLHGHGDPRHEIQQSLRRLRPHCHWTDGTWEGLGLKWNEVQNVPKHVRGLSDLLVRLDFHLVAESGMKFIYADSLDFVDPRYDFLTDRSPNGREAYWDDLYPHEILGYAPYDGLLVSHAIVMNGKYSLSQAMRFRLVGAREFLRLPEEKFPGSWIFGDCGAFSYHDQVEPPYSVDDMIEFYGECGFTHGCSVDHVIFEFDEKARDLNGGTPEARRRFEITLENAQKFLRAAKPLGNRFTPVGVIQGWSPDSMAVAAEKLQAMGYEYLAVGGMVPLKSPQIHACLDAIRSKTRPDIGLAHSWLRQS